MAFQGVCDISRKDGTSRGGGGGGNNQGYLGLGLSHAQRSVVDDLGKHELSHHQLKQPSAGLVLVLAHGERSGAIMRQNTCGTSWDNEGPLRVDSRRARRAAETKIPER